MPCRLMRLVCVPKERGAMPKETLRYVDEYPKLGPKMVVQSEGV